MFFCRSAASFGARSLYFQDRHVGVWDYYSAISEGKISEDYVPNSWGFENTKLYEYVKVHLSDMAKNEASFAVTLLTVDTHA